jgi:hypothetical protein
VNPREPRNSIACAAERFTGPSYSCSLRTWPTTTPARYPARGGASRGGKSRACSRGGFRSPTCRRKSHNSTGAGGVTSLVEFQGRPARMISLHVLGRKLRRDGGIPLRRGDAAAHARSRQRADRTGRFDRMDRLRCRDSGRRQLAQARPRGGSADPLVGHRREIVATAAPETGVRLPNSCAAVGDFAALRACGACSSIAAP